MEGRHAVVMKVIAAIVALGILVSAIVVVSIVRSGLSAHGEPTAVEAWMARTVRHWAVPSELREMKNPVAATPAIIAEGREHFAADCALCHGNDGKGGGLGRLMYPKTPDMTAEATQSLSDGEIFATIENGVRLSGMPGWGTGTAESAHRTWVLVHFIRHLPRLTPEEIEQMKTLNPKSSAHTGHQH